MQIPSQNMPSLPLPEPCSRFQKLRAANRSPRPGNRPPRSTEKAPGAITSEPPPAPSNFEFRFSPACRGGILDSRPLSSDLWLTLTSSKRRSPQRNDRFKWHSGISAAHCNLNQPRQNQRIGPSIHPHIQARLEIADLQAPHVLNQRHPRLVLMCDGLIIHRFAQETQ